jgi:hypothetical protein
MPVGGVSMYAYPSYRPNRSIPADHGGSRYRGNGDANNPDVENRGHRSNSKHFIPVLDLPEDRLRQAAKSSDVAVLLPGTYSCPQRRDKGSPKDAWSL